MLKKILDFPPDSAIDSSLAAVFSKPSLTVHTIWFVYWFAAKLDVGLLTNIVSLEAIYIGILIGIQQMKHHKKTLKAIKPPISVPVKPSPPSSPPSSI